MGAVGLVVGLMMAGLNPPAPAAAGLTASCRPMTVRQKAAQTVMTGLPGPRADDTTLRLVRRHAGSVVLLGRNVRSAEQLRRLTRRLRRNAPARMLVAVDEEGGRVARLGEKGIVTRLPSARTMARTRSTDQIRKAGRRVGRQMVDVGISWNLAPVLDVAGAHRNTVIGDRSYSGDPAVAAVAGAAFAQGLQAAGLLTTGKHFPGHGRTTVDSHQSLPTVDASLRQLRRRDLKPFVRALPSLDAVMSAHVRYTAIDRKRPASLSRAATRLLRDELGHDGILITDALEMGAITSRYSVPQAAEMALRSGADVLLVGDWWRTEKVTDRLAAAVHKGRVHPGRLNSAAAKVLAAKGYRPAMVDCLVGRG